MNQAQHTTLISAREPPASKKAYVPPHLEVYGSVATLTQSLSQNAFGEAMLVSSALKVDP